MPLNPLELDSLSHDLSLKNLRLSRHILADPPAPPPPPPNQQSTTGFATPDPIVVIILGILLFALICAAFLNSILRCLLRRRRLRAWRAAAEAAAANGHGNFPGAHGMGGDGAAAVAHGLDPKILHSLPVLEFLKNNESSSTDNLRAGDCSICLSEFSEKEKLRLLPKCSHIFHQDCIDMWLQSHTSCPVCRDTIVEGAGAHMALGQAMQLRAEENGASLVSAGTGAPTIGSGPDSRGLMLLIQDENGHSVAAAGSTRRDAPSFRLVATNPGSSGGGSESSRRLFVPEVPSGGRGAAAQLQDDHEQGLQLVPMAQQPSADSANSSRSKTYFVFEAGYFFSGNWLASSSSSSSTSAMPAVSASSASTSNSGSAATTMATQMSTIGDTSQGSTSPSASKKSAMGDLEAGTMSKEDGATDSIGNASHSTAGVPNRAAGVSNSVVGASGLASSTTGSANAYESAGTHEPSVASDRNATKPSLV